MTGEQDFRRKADTMLDQRLSSIDDELKALRELFTRQVRNEEQLITMFKKMESLDGDVKTLKTQVHTLEISHAKQGVSISGGERFFWLAVAAGMAWIGAHFK